MDSVSQEELTENKIESKKHMTTHMKSIFVGALASFALLTLVASPSRAESRATNANTTTSSKTEQQISQTPPSPTKQQSEDKGCPCCKKMMGNTQQMDSKIHQMMNNQQSPSR
ncbi:hypothetical protein RIVM261_049570 [Rivularia sp. IAM M-261]|nr:hypothetical protein RIVM261_049570 [Rivularia sp. IAM M-261]